MRLLRNEKKLFNGKMALTIHKQAYYSKKLKSTFSLNKKGKIWISVEQSITVGD